jgi:hypothetical protein
LNRLTFFLLGAFEATSFVALTGFAVFLFTLFVVIFFFATLAAGRRLLSFAARADAGDVVFFAGALNSVPRNRSGSGLRGSTFTYMASVLLSSSRRCLGVNAYDGSTKLAVSVNAAVAATIAVFTLKASFVFSSTLFPTRATTVLSPRVVYSSQSEDYRLIRQSLSAFFVYSLSFIHSVRG